MEMHFALDLDLHIFLLFLVLIASKLNLFHKNMMKPSSCYGVVSLSLAETEFCFSPQVEPRLRGLEEDSFLLPYTGVTRPLS